MSRFTVPSTLCVLVLTLVSLPVAYLQNLFPCNSSLDQIPVQAFVYGVYMRDSTVCPLANVAQDAVVCIPQAIPLSITRSQGNADVCLANESLCDILPVPGPYNAVAIILRDTAVSGFVEISTMFNVSFGLDTLPLNISSGLTLYFPGDVVLLERVWTTFIPPRVCQELPNGTIINGTIINSLLSARYDPNDCLMAAKESVQSGRSIAKSLVLSSPPTSIDEGTVSLFLVPGSETSCSASAKRLSNTFTINLVNETALTTEPPTVTTPDTPVETPRVEVIGIAVGAVTLVLVVVVAVVISFVCFVYMKRQRRRRIPVGDGNNFNASHSGSPSSVRGSSVDPKLPLVPRIDTTDGDSGVGRSPGPSTPGDYLIVVVGNLDASQYSQLKSELGSVFSAGFVEFVLPRPNSDETIQEFIRNVHQRATSPQVKYIFLLHNLRNLEHSESFKKVHQYFEARPCEEFYKVWYWRFGAPGNEAIDGAIHIRNISEPGTWKECARNISRQIDSYTLQHGHPDDYPLTATTSFTPHQFPVKETLIRSPSTEPMAKKQLEALEDIKKTQKVIVERLDNVQNTNNATLEAAQKQEPLLRGIVGKTSQIKEGQEDTLIMLENQAYRSNPIVGEEPPDSTES